MPSWISRLGKWVPKHEHVVLPQFQGTDKEVYDGPDRAALEVLKEQGVENLGEDFRDNAEMIEVATKFNCDTPEEYARKRGWKPEADSKRIEEESKKVNTHSAPKKQKGVFPEGGSPLQKGGWEDPRG